MIWSVVRLLQSTRVLTRWNFAVIVIFMKNFVMIKMCDIHFNVLVLARFKRHVSLKVIIPVDRLLLDLMVVGATIMWLGITCTLQLQWHNETLHQSGENFDFLGERIRRKEVLFNASNSWELSDLTESAFNWNRFQTCKGYIPQRQTTSTVAFTFV